MERLRHHLMRRRGWAAWLVAAALLMKLLVPAGYMPVAIGGSIALELCSGAGPEQMRAMPGMAGHEHDSGGKHDMPCGFAGLTLPALAADDPMLLGIAIAFIVASIFRSAIVSIAGPPAFLRPPLRGPPAIN